MAVAERHISTEERINTLARKISMAILAAVPGPIIAWLYFTQRFRGLIFADAMDFAQIARNLSQGHGFSTNLIRPLMLAFTDKMGLQPDILRPPLHAVVTALLFGAMGARDEVAAYSSLIFYLLTIPMIYVLAARMFNQRIAVLSAVLYVASDRMIGYGMSGLPISLLTFLVTSLLLVAFGRKTADDSDPTPKRSRAIWAGILTALCYLTEYSTILFLIPVGIYLYRSGGRLRRSQLAFYLISFLVVSAPWMIRNYSLTGNPFFTMQQYELLMQTSTYPGYSYYRIFPSHLSSPVLFALTTFMQMIRKILAISTILYSQLPQMTSLFLMPFFMVGIFYSLGRRVGQFRWCIYGMMIASIVAMSLQRGATEVFVPFVPIIIVLAAAFFTQVLDRTPLHRFYQNAVAGLITLIVAYPMLLALIMGGTPATNPAQPSLTELEKMIPMSEPIVSDIPWAVAWYSKHTAVWIPQTTQDYQQIEKKVAPLNVIYLSSMISTYPDEEQVNSWKQSYFQAKAPTGFGLAKAWPERMLLFIRLKPGAETKKSAVKS